MLVVIAPSERTAQNAARRRGLRPGIDCLLVYDIETLQMTCLQDFNRQPIEEDPLGIPIETRRAMVEYLADLNANPKLGFGWRHWYTETDN